MLSSKHRILVFPCGSEIGLEIYRSLRHSTHFEIIGASSTDDHGRFIFPNYIEGIPFHDSPEFLTKLKSIVKEYRIDAIYPAMDSVASTLKNIENNLDCKIICSNSDATNICASKSATYNHFSQDISCPKQYSTLESAIYPVFIKPDRGYGARHCFKAENLESAKAFIKNNPHGPFLIQEFLPGKEWTIDCFSDRHGSLRFHGVRGRDRISNGISVRTTTSTDFSELFLSWANLIQKKLSPQGAWFFQAKADRNGHPTLLEIAVRPGGSSGIFRCQGVNFALLSAFDAFEKDVLILQNNYTIELDRALTSSYKLEIKYQHVYLDLDDCLISNNRVNEQLVSFLHQAINSKKTITLITRHTKNLQETLKSMRISELFDKIIHLKNREKKSSHIHHKEAIFIDDSFSERQDVALNCKIPVFSPDMVEALFE